MSSTNSSGGSGWFMVLSLAAMLAALILVGLQMRKPAAVKPASTTSGTAPAPEAAPPVETGPSDPGGPRNM